MGVLKNYDVGQELDLNSFANKNEFQTFGEINKLSNNDDQEVVDCFLNNNNNINHNLLQDSSFIANLQKENLKKLKDEKNPKETQTKKDLEDANKKIKEIQEEKTLLQENTYEKLFTDIKNESLLSANAHGRKNEKNEKNDLSSILKTKEEKILAIKQKPVTKEETAYNLNNASNLTSNNALKDKEEIPHKATTTKSGHKPGIFNTSNNTPNIIAVEKTEKTKESNNLKVFKENEKEKEELQVKNVKKITDEIDNLLNDSHSKCK